MNGLVKPMLAGRPEGMDDIALPVIASPKLDGIRCLIIDGHAVSRTFKPIPNTFTREWLEANCPDGFDGELMVRGEDFSGTTSGIMRESGEPNFYYAVFDYVQDGLTLPFVERIARLRAAAADIDPTHLWVVPQTLLDTREALEAAEEQFVSEHYEGIMVRKPDGPYKCGRSSVREGYLLKLKRFADGEAVILSAAPLLHNENEAEQDAFGRTKRSQSAEGMVAEEALGSFHVRDVESGVEFDIGTGFDAAERADLWARRDSLIGQLLKYKSQKHGAKDAPRFPVFIGFRDRRDL